MGYHIKEVTSLGSKPVFAMMTTILLLIFCDQGFPGEPGRGRSFEDLAESYQLRDAELSEAAFLESELLSIAEDLAPADLWRSILESRRPAKNRAANGLALIRILFPHGDASKWAEVSGFWFPPLIPKPLAALDAVFYTSIALLEMNEPGAHWIAARIMDGLRNSSRAALLSMRTAPREYRTIISQLEAKTSVQPIGGWPGAEIRGELPFASAAASYATQEKALSTGMVFLNNSGQPVSGTGPFAWDRKKGRIYRVVESLDDIDWWLIP